MLLIILVDRKYYGKRSSAVNDTMIISDDPLDFIRRCVREGRILWTYHVNMRMKDRFISRRMILESIDNYEIIESYPEDWSDDFKRRLR